MATGCGDGSGRRGTESAWWAGRIVKLPGAEVTRVTVRVSGAPGAGLSEIGVY